MPIKIREAREEDLDEIVDMWARLAFDHQEMMEGYDLCYDARENWREFVEDGLDKNVMNTFIAEDEDELIGFLNVVIRERLDIFEERYMGMILDVFVKEKWRAKGIGTSLTKRAEEWIKMKGVNIAVLTVSPQNSKAADFWKNRGYDTYLLKKRKEL